MPCVSYCDGATLYAWGRRCFLLLFWLLTPIERVKTMNPGKYAGVEKGY